MVATAEAEKQRPRLKNLDDLFKLGEESETVVNTKPSTELHSASRKRFQAVLELEKLIPFSGHPFRPYEGERLDDLVESIKANGVLVPIIVRETETSLEILSGHNRVNASRLAGLTTIPSIVVRNVSDEEAWVYVIETNLLQRSFTDMSHSEKAAVLSVQHSKLFSQGKRNDILAELRLIENPHGNEEKGTFAQVGEKLHSDKKVGEMYSLSKNTVARYLRINKLIPDIKTLLDCGVIAFMPAVTLSFLKEREQKELAKSIKLSGFTVDMKKADILRQYSSNGKLDDERIFLILNGELGQKPKPKRTPTVKIKKDVYARYFQPNQSAKEIEAIVEKALVYYFLQRT